MKNTLLVPLVLAGLVAAGCSGSSSSGSNSTGGGSGGPCGTVTVQGQCTGSILEYCDSNSGQIVEENCSQVVPDGGDVYACQLIDAAYGYDCAAPAGKSCVQVDSLNEAYPSFCQGMGPACVYGVGGSATCELNLPPCVGYDDDGGYVFSGAPANTAACSGALLQFYCDENQPVAQDCTVIGGSCATADAGGRCVNLPMGQQCDNIEFFCVAPLNCFDPDGGDVGFCG